MDQVLEFLKGFNVQTILSLGAIIWYFHRHTDAKLEKMEVALEKTEFELKELVKVQSARSDQLYQMFIELLRDKK